MSKGIRVFLLLLLSTVCTTYAGPSLMARLYCSILGDKDARPEYRQIVYQALQSLGVEEPANVPVKQMNAIGPAFARVPLSTFTAFGIWLDEPYLNTCSQEEQLFHLYHEAAHYALNHHQKLLVGCGVAAVFMTVVFLKAESILGDICPLVKNTAAAGAGILIALGCYRYVLPQVVKRQEKQADLLAARTLKVLGRQDIVVAHVENLKKASDGDDGALWWFSNHEQAEYLESVLAETETLS
jgi:hypothetical protein